MSEYPTLQHQWFEEVWNQGRAQSIDDLLCSDCVGHGLVDAEGKEVEGIDAFKEFYNSFRGAFPDIHVEVQDTVTQGDQIVARCLVTGTHRGEGFVSAPTNRKVSFTGTCWVRVRDGKIAESWNHFDFMTVMQQIGGP